MSTLRYVLMLSVLGLALLWSDAQAKSPFGGGRYRMERQRSWTMGKSGVRVQQYRILDKANKQVGYRRVYTGKDGRRTVVEQNLSKGVKRSTTKFWRGNNGTRFRAHTIQRTNGAVFKVREARGRKGGSTRVASTPGGSEIRDKSWIAKETRFTHRTVTGSSGAKRHSRTGRKVLRLPKINKTQLSGLSKLRLEWKKQGNRGLPELGRQLLKSHEGNRLGRYWKRASLKSKDTAAPMVGAR